MLAGRGSPGKVCVPNHSDASTLLSQLLGALLANQFLLTINAYPSIGREVFL